MAIPYHLLLSVILNWKLHFGTLLQDIKQRIVGVPRSPPTLPEVRLGLAPREEWVGAFPETNNWSATHRRRGRGRGQRWQRLDAGLDLNVDQVVQQRRHTKRNALDHGHVPATQLGRGRQGTFSGARATPSPVPQQERAEAKENQQGDAKRDHVRCKRGDHSVHLLVRKRSWKKNP